MLPGLGFSSPTEVPSGGLRSDAGKNRLDLIPPEWIEGIGEVLTFGANKYDDRNWEKGMKWGRTFAPLMRHGWKFWRGEQKDEESNLHHMLHVAVNALFLYTYDKHELGEDDRGKLA